MTHSTRACKLTLRRDAHGNNRWYLDGMLHRIDGPAFEGTDGTKVWWANGEMHRADGPAVERASGYKEWRLNGELHRADGPAIEYCDGAKEWYLKGERHRTDGPCFEKADGTKEWWVNGEHISPPYSYVLTAAFVCGLPIPLKVFPEVTKAMSKAHNNAEAIGLLKVILTRHWPKDVNKILVTLFSDLDPLI